METGVIEGGSYLYLSLKQIQTKGNGKFKTKSSACPHFLLTEDKIQTSGTELLIICTGHKVLFYPTLLVQLPKHQTK